MPAEAKTHTFMTGPSFNGSSMLFLMFWTKAGTVRDSEKATILSKSFYFNAAFLIEPRLTVTIDGTPWIEGLQGWWSGETSNTYTMDVPHHAKVRMSTSVLDASNYCGSRDHTLTMDLELFSFDFRIKKE